MIITIVATTKYPASPISWIIKKVQKTEYSHFAIIVKSFVLEATARGTSLARLEDFQKKNKTIKSWEFDLDIYPEVLYEWMASILGTKYGFMQNVGYLLMAMKILNHNPFGRGTKRLVCSEVIALFLQKFAGLQIKDSDKYDLVETEKALERVC